MAKYRFTILILLFFPCFLFSFQSTIQVDSNVVRIHLSTNSNSDTKAYSSDSTGYYLRYVIAAHSDFIPTIIIDSVQYQVANLQDLDSTIRVGSIPKILNPKLELIGTYRGVDLYSLRIDLLKKNKKKLFMLSQGNIILNFPSLLRANTKYDISRFSAFRNQLINPEHIPFLLNHVQQLKQSSEYAKSQPSDMSWYNPELEYIALNTYHDGIGVIPVSKILEIQPSLVGKSYSHLHLVSLGQMQPYTLRDSDGMIDASDTILYVSQRAKGETTWYNEFITYHTMYFYYDDANISKQYSPIPQVETTQAIVEKVFSRLHIEKDSLYANGIELQYTETVSGEGWYHKLLNPQRFSEAIVNTKLYPAPNENVEVKSGFFVKKFNTDIVFNHNILTQINHSLALQEEYRYKNADYYKYNTITLLADNFFAGDNQIKYTSIGYKDNEKYDIYLDELALDFTEVSGMTLPVTLNGKADFYIDTLQEDSELIMFPFDSENIITIDTINHYLISTEPIRGFPLEINTSNQLNQTRFRINDEVIAESNRIGFHLLKIDLTTLNKEYYYYPENETEQLISKINSISGESLIAIAVNTLNLSEQQKDLLRSIDFDLTAYHPSNCFVGIQNRANNRIIASNSSESIAKLYSFIPSIAGVQFAAKCRLPKSKAYHIIAQSINQVEIGIIKKVEKSNLKDLTKQYNYIIITSKQFAASAQKYLSHRQVTHSNLKMGIVYVEDIYKEFNFGIKSSLAIKEYLKYAYNNWTNEELGTVLLLGDACTDVRKIQINTLMNDYVPSYGNPTSDTWYTFLDSDIDNMSDIYISRIPIKNDTDFDNYFEKLKNFESARSAPWMNSFLFLTGGNTFDEIGQFEYIVTNPYRQLFQDSKLCNTTDKIVKSYEGGTDFHDGIRVVNALNEGRIYTNFVGHGSPVILDLDWKLESLNNSGKYGIFHTVSCNTAAFGLIDGNTKFEESLFAKDKGFVLCIGASFVDNVEIGANVAKAFATLILEDDYRNPVSAFIDAKNQSYILNSDNEQSKHYSQYLYQATTLGDPLLLLPFSTQPELYMRREEVKVSSVDKVKSSDKSDTVDLEFAIRNLGTNEFEQVEVMIVDNYKTKSDTIYSVVDVVCPFSSISVPINVLNKYGLHTATITIDPNHYITEQNIINNSLTLQFEVLRNEILPIEPLAYHSINSQSPYFRFINPLNSEDSLVYNFEVYDREVNPSYSLKSYNNEISIDDGVIDWKPTRTLPSDMNLNLKANYTNLRDNSVSEDLIIPFHSVSEPLTENSDYWIKAEQLANMNLNNLEYNSTSQSINVTSDSVDFYLLGICGINDVQHPVYRTAYMSLNGETVLAPLSLVGFFVVHFDSEFKTHKWRYYNTWGIYDEKNSIKDSASIEMVKYLRDSVNTDDNIFIATYGSAFRLFSLHNKWHTSGSWDTLKTVLDAYGAKMTYTIDTLTKANNAWTVSYVLAANISKTNPIVFEDISVIGDTAMIKAKLPKYYRNAELEFDLEQVAELKNIKYSIDELHKFSKIRTKIYAWNDGDITRSLIIDTLTTPILDIKESDANFRNYSVNLIAEDMTSDSPRLSINQISADYLPLSEISIKRINDLKSESLNGDYDTLRVKLKNLSLRRNIDSIQIASLITDTNIEIDKQDSVIHNLKPNSEIIVEQEINSDNYPLMIELRNTANILNESELYSFNNSFNLKQTFVPDTVKPEIFLELDGHLVQDGEYIPIRPEFKAYIKDNSKRVINSESNLKLKINARPYVNNSNSEDYQFISYPKGAEIKAEIIFTPDSLDFDENIVRIFVEDANHNRDTAYYKFIVNRRGSIKQLSIYPNPLQVNSTIEFDYAATVSGGYSHIEIYNYAGQLINDYKMSLNIGKNQVPIIITDRNNSKLAPGVYFYRISVKNTDILVEPMTDKFIIVQ